MFFPYGIGSARFWFPVATFGGCEQSFNFHTFSWLPAFRLKVRAPAQPHTKVKFMEI